MKKAELTDDPVKLYAKLYYKGIKPIAKKEVYREVVLVNVYRDEDVR